MIITGAGQHSAPEEGPKLRATVERLLTALHLGNGSHEGPAPGVAPASASAQPSVRDLPSNGLHSRTSILTHNPADTRRRQRLVAFKASGVQHKAKGQDNGHSVAAPDAGAAEPTAASPESAVADSRGNVPPLVGPWSRSEAARLLTEAILLDWTNPWQPGTARGVDRRTGGRGSWAAAAGVRSRVAETTARLGTDWLSAAAADHDGAPAAPPMPAKPADSDISEVADGEGVEWQSSGAQADGHAATTTSAAEESMSAVVDGQQQPGNDNAGRVIVPQSALVAWLGSKPARPPS